MDSLALALFRKLAGVSGSCQKVCIAALSFGFCRFGRLGDSVAFLGVGVYGTTIVEVGWSHALLAAPFIALLITGHC